MALRRLRVILVLLVVTALFSAFPPAEAEQPTHRRVLFVSSYHPGYPSFFPQVQGLRAGLAEAGYARDNVTIDIEFMDAKRFPRAEVEPWFRPSLAYKLTELPRYDVVVVADDDAFEFALDNQASLFRGLPIVFLGVSNEKKALAQDANPMVVGVIEARPVRDTLRLIEKLYPNSRTIHAVVDDTLTGKTNRELLEREARALSRHEIKIHLLGKQSYGDVFAALKQIGPDTPLFLNCSARDRDGRSFDFYRFLANVKAAFNGPIFAVQAHGLGHGVLGGKMVSHEEQGRAAARLAAQILDGTPVASLRVVAEGQNVYAFDYAEAVRLGIDPASLPRDARFVNDPLNILDEYFAWMLAGAAFIALQMALIVLLLLNNRERKRAVTSLRAAMGRAEQANRAKSEFLSRMSHELRTPLNAIIGFSEIVKKELLGPIGVQRYRSYAEDIHKSGTHLLAIINDLLEITKMSAGEVRLQEQTVDAQVLIDNAMMQVEVNARKQGVLLNRKPAPPRLRLRADPRRITQILLNLLSNAVKFTPSGGSVDVGIERGRDGALLINVTDTGIGMSEEDLTQIVLPFRQVENAFSTSHEGTGLGVPIALELARLHGGTILYESAPDKGTTATLVLPAERVVRHGRGTLAAQG